MQRELEIIKPHLESTQLICELTEAINQYAQSIEELKNPRLPEHTRLNELEKMKTFLDAMASSPLMPYHLQWILDLKQCIENLQNQAVIIFLDEIRQLVLEVECDKGKFYRLEEVLNEHLPNSSPLGEQVLFDIHKEVWINGGKPLGDLLWGRHHAFDDLRRLSEAIQVKKTNLQRFSEVAQVKNDEPSYNIDQLDIVNLEPHPDLRPNETESNPFLFYDPFSENSGMLEPGQECYMLSDLEKMMHLLANTPIPNEKPIDTLISKVTKILMNGNLNSEERTQKINKAREKVPVDLRNKLDELVFINSPISNKGGEGWGGQHAAEQPDILLKSAEQLNQSLNSNQTMEV
jgi:hypothetical protein